MTALQNKQILLAVTGGIAAYKTPDLVRRLRDLGASVRVVMSPAAQQFIGALSLQAVSGHRVHTSLLDEEAEAAMGHIELARWADAIVVAPTSADTLARLAAGRADELIAALVRASEAPVLLAPAMNQAMWADALTAKNMAALAEQGYHFVGPDAGSQACGEVGPGRMSEPLAIAEATAELFDSGALQGCDVVITAGPTREALDPVRYLSNHSTGKMGFALAEAAAEAGARVRLVAGPVDLPTPARVERIDVESAEQMLAACQQCLSADAVFIATAAVADYRPAEVATQKIKKAAAGDELTLQLVSNPDILRTVALGPERPRWVVGFAAETQNLEANAERKLLDKQLDMIVANDVSRSDIGFGADNNEVLLLERRAGAVESAQGWGVLSKTQLARRIIERLGERLGERPSA